MFYAVPTASPDSIQSMIVNSTAVIITWLPPVVDDQNGIITAYIVNVSLEDNDTVPLQYTTSSLSVMLVEVYPFSTYVVFVAAETSVGRGPFSRSLRISTPEDGRQIMILITVLGYRSALNFCLANMVVASLSHELLDLRLPGSFFSLLQAFTLIRCILSEIFN